jgi:hypothetical protein
MSKQDKNLVAYCGLYCGDCFFYQGKIADLARDLRKELRKAKLDQNYKEFIKFAKGFEKFNQCYELLGAMVRMRCKRTCRNGGGPPFCKIRKCCQEKNITGCWECEEFETCEKLDFLKPTHKDAHIKNLRFIKKQGIDKFIESKRYW